MGDEESQPFQIPETKVLGERSIYDNPWVRLVLVDIETPDGRRFEHHVVRLQTVSAGLVVVDGRVLMLYRHRFATAEVGWELPGGIVEQGEDPAVCAAREVEEETGWRPSQPMEHLVSFQPMPGIVDTPHKVYVSQGAEHIGDPTDMEEAGHVDWVPLADVPAMVTRGEILGSGSLVGLLHYLALNPSDVGR